MGNDMETKRFKKAVSAEAFVFLIFLAIIFGGIGMKMGGANMMQTMMATAYELLIDTVYGNRCHCGSAFRSTFRIWSNRTLK